MASANGPPKRSPPRRKSFCNVFVWGLVVWAVAGILFAARAARHIGKTQGNEALSLSWMQWRRSTPRRTNATLHMDPVQANRRFLSRLLSEDALRETLVEDIWREAFLSGVSVIASESMALLLQNIRPPNVRLAPCDKPDLTLAPLPKNITRLFIASNQHQSAHILPSFIRQVLDFILDNPGVTFFVSIYESGSVDRTPYLLLLLERVLNEIGVGNMIEYNGSLNRKQGQERIEFLADVRNAALQPLIDHHEQGIEYDRLIFINDVYFCKQDMHRLLLHDGDLNCGMDFVHHTIMGRETKFDPNEVEAVKRLYYKERVKNDEPVLKAISTPAPVRPWNKKKRTEPYKFVASDPDTWMDFYDIWVSHDAAGRHFSNMPPYVTNHSYEHQRLSEGLPFPAECCWNGVAILNPEPFTKHGLLFRAASQDECKTSECVLLCHDFQRLGYRRVTVDPGVWTTYDYLDARLLSLVGVRGLDKVPWKTVQEAPPMEDIHIVPGQLVDCCPLQPGKEIVDFDECLTNYSIWNVKSALDRFNLVEESPVPIPVDHIEVQEEQKAEDITEKVAAEDKGDQRSAADIVFEAEGESQAADGGATEGESQETAEQTEEKSAEGGAGEVTEETAEGATEENKEQQQTGQAENAAEQAEKQTARGSTEEKNEDDSKKENQETIAAQEKTETEGDGKEEPVKEETQDPTTEKQNKAKDEESKEDTTKVSS